MRLRQVDLRAVYRYVMTQTSNGYIGTSSTPVYIDSFFGNIQPAENKLNAEIYGTKVTDMLTIYCDDNVPIEHSNMIGLTEGETPQYRVISVKSYFTHKVVEVEKWK